MTDNSGTHESFAERGAVKTSSDRSFGIVFTVVFAVIGLAPLLSGHPVRWWSLGVAGAFLAVALIYPRLLAPLNRAWTKFGLLLHHIVNPLVMGMLFFLVVTPIALAMRLCGKRTLAMELDPAASSYWIERSPPGPAPETMKQQF
jgi:hypothetical protein